MPCQSYTAVADPSFGATLATGGIPPRPPAQAATNNPPPPSSLADINDDPAEVDLGAHANPLSLLAGTGPDSQNPFAAFGGGAGGGPPGEDPFSQMMAQMMAGMGGGAPGTGSAGAAQANPFMGGAAGQNPASAFAPAPKTLLERFFPLVHITLMLALAVYVICVYEPAKRAATSYGWSEGRGSIDWSAWSALLTRRPTELGLGSSALHSLATVVSLVLPSLLRVGPNTS